MADHLSRQQLYDLVWSEPISKIAPRLGVSDVWLAKLCRNANIPLPPRGYWVKSIQGTAREQTPLPPASDDIPEMVAITRGKSKQPAVEPTQQEKIGAEVPARPPIPVPKELRHPHPFVAETRSKAKIALPQDDGRLLVMPERNVFALRVSRRSLGRALRLLQAICDEVERRGWKIQSGGSIATGRRAYPVRITERAQRVPFTDYDIRRWRAQSPISRQDKRPPENQQRREPTGMLTLTLSSPWGSSLNRWTDTRRGRIEDQLVEFFATLSAQASADEVHGQQQARKELERLTRDRVELIERARVQRLDDEILAVHRAKLIRDYVAKIRARLDDVSPERREQLLAWCNWAEARSDRLDPVINLDLIKGLDDERDGWG